MAVTSFPSWTNRRRREVTQGSLSSRGRPASPAVAAIGEGVVLGVDDGLDHGLGLGVGGGVGEPRGTCPP